MTFPFTFSCIPLLGQASGAGFIFLSSGEQLVAPDGYSFYLVEKGTNKFFSDMVDAVVPVIDNNKPIFVTKDGVDYIVSLVNIRNLLLPTLLGQRQIITKSFNTAYFNDSGYTMKVSVIGSFSGSPGKYRILCDTNPNPTLQIASNSTSNTFFAISVTALIPNLHYYKVAALDGTPNVPLWSEMIIFGG